MFILSSSKDPGVFESFTLSNGVKVYHKRVEQSFGMPKVACCIAVEVGGRDDPKNKEGSAHFFEHMPFRGTQNFPSLEALTQEIENNGGYVNAFTTDESTGYEVIVPSEMFESALQRASDMLISPILRNSDIEIERKVILEELRNKHASVSFFARRKLIEGLLDNHPLVHAVIGTEEALLSINKEDLQGFHKRYYTADNISLFVVGDYSETDLRELAEKYLATVPIGEKTSRNDIYPKGKKFLQPHIFEPVEYNRSIYLLGRVLPSLTLKESASFRIFSDMLTRGLHSPLYDEIREKRGLAYSLGFTLSQYHDLSLFSFSVSTQYKQMEEIHLIAWREMHKILENKERFEEVKLAVKQSILHREYSVGSIICEAVDEVLDYGRVIPMAEYVSLLDELTIQDVKTAVAPYLVESEFLNIRVNCDRA